LELSDFLLMRKLISRLPPIVLIIVVATSSSTGQITYIESANSLIGEDADIDPGGLNQKFARLWKEV
jgi:hypothetical protein